MVIVRDPGPVDGVKAQKLEDALSGYGSGGAIGDDDDSVQDHDDHEDEEEVGESISLTVALKKRETKGNGKHEDKWAGNRTGEKRWCQKVRLNSKCLKHKSP